MKQNINRGTGSTRKSSAGQIEQGKMGPAQSKQDEEIRIIVMGRSGAGKSSFINLASNSTLRVGSSLESCTENIELSQPFELQGRRVRLIDTPGFDDSSKSDAEVLNTIANFLANEYRNGRKLSGLIYFHRISDVRMGAISKRNFVMFQKLCGSAALANVVLSTTRWSEVKQAVGEAREAELRTKEAFFKPVIDAGAPLMRYMRTPESALEMLNHLVAKPPLPLLIQKEMVDEGKRLSETEAGMALQSEITEQVKRHEEDMRTLMEELEAIKQDDDEGTQELDAEVKELREKVLRLKEETQRISSAQLPSSVTPKEKDNIEIPRPPSRNTVTSDDAKSSGNVTLRPPSRRASGASSRHMTPSIPRPPSRNAASIPATPASDVSTLSSNPPSTAPVASTGNMRPSRLRSPSKDIPIPVTSSGNALPSIPRPPSRNAGSTNIFLPRDPAPLVPPRNSSSVSRDLSKQTAPSIHRSPPKKDPSSSTNSSKNSAPSSNGVPLVRQAPAPRIAASESMKPAPTTATSVPSSKNDLASSTTIMPGSLSTTANVAPARAQTEATSMSTEQKVVEMFQRKGRDGQQRARDHGAPDAPEEGILGRWIAKAQEVGMMATVAKTWEGLSKWWWA